MDQSQGNIGAVCQAAHLFLLLDRDVGGHQVVDFIEHVFLDVEFHPADEFSVHCLDVVAKQRAVLESHFVGSAADMDDPHRRGIRGEDLLHRRLGQDVIARRFIRDDHRAL